MSKKSYLFYLRYILAGLAAICLIAAFGMLGFHLQKEDIKKVPQRPTEVHHRVLFLSSYSSTYFTYSDQEMGLKDVLYNNGIEFDIMFMDAKKFGRSEDKQIFHDFLKERLLSTNEYEGILLGDDDALQFAMDYQEELFAGLPMIFFGVNDLQFAQDASRNPLVAGFYEKDYLQETIETAMKALPDRKTFVGLHDVSTAGLSDMNIFFSYAEKFPEYVFMDIDTSKLTQDELIRALKNLPENSVLFYMTCYNDKEGNVYSMLSRTSTVVNNANVPIFRNYSGGRDSGVLGGTYMDFFVQAKQAALVMSDILNDKAETSKFGLFMDSPSRTVYNYPLLMEYGISLSALPEDTEFVDRPSNFFERYKNIMPVVIMMLIAMGLFILAMYVALRAEKIINEELRHSQEEIESSRGLLEYQAQYDDFLDVFNRRAMVEYLNKSVTMNQVYSVIMLDVDGFKDVNENYGHEAGDKILKKIACSLQEFCAKNQMTLGRYGGDEFLMFCPGELLDENSKRIIELKRLFSRTLSVDNIDVTLSVSIGISNSDGLTYPEQHIINAEIALYEAKERGRGMVFVYTDDMKKKVNSEENIKTKFIKAFEEDGFYMKYQPKVNAKTKEVVGFEALIRMKDDSYAPSLFIPVIEKSGWIVRLGRHVTFLVIKQLSEWKAQGKKLRPVSINFSSKQIHDIGYVTYLQELLEMYDIDPQYIEIEITESLLVENSTQSDELFSDLKKLGIRLLMDDFGTGYSSLGYLIYVPVDDIKLDKTLVDAYLIDGKDSFIRDVIQLVHDMHKEITIEGVECKWQYDKLLDFNADIIQGYYFSKALEPSEAIDFCPQ